MSDKHVLDNPDLHTALNTIARMNRRSFLAFSGAAIAAASAGGLPLPARAARLTFITEAESAVFVKLAEVVLPVSGSKLTPWTPEVLLQTLDSALLGTMEPHILQGLKGGIGYFNEGPVATHGKPFVQLSDEEATRFCDQWSDSDEVPQRALAMGLKKLVQLAYWANPASWPPIGYDGPVSKRAGLESLGNAELPLD